MKRYFPFLLLLGLFGITNASFAEGVGVEIAVSLSPAGSYTATTSKIKGGAQQKGSEVSAKGILVDMRSLKTGIELRDKHTKERLQTQKYPVAKLVEASGKDGKGKGVIELMGKKRNVEGTYKIDGKHLVAEFKMILSELDIKDVRYMGVGVKDEITVKVTVPVSGGK